MDEVQIAGLIAVFGTLGGVVVGGLLEGYRQKKAFERQRDWERSQFRRQKLELLASTANDVSSSLDSLFELTIKQLRPGLEDASLEDAMLAAEELSQSQARLNEIPFSYLEMLVEFYAKDELSGLLPSVRRSQATIGQSAMKVLFKDNPSIAVVAAADAITELKRTCAELVTGAAELAQREPRFGIKRD